MNREHNTNKHVRRSPVDRAVRRGGVGDYLVGGDKMQAEKIMCDCGHLESEHSEVTRGYGTDRTTGKTYCYACCADKDRQIMHDTGRITLYLCGHPGEYRVKNWPGSLVLLPYRVRIGRHNMTGKRYDVWFAFENRQWHGVQYGDNTQICHCRRSAQ